MDLNPQDILSWVGASKGLLDLFKTSRDLLPKGKERDDLDARIGQAEETMKRADAALAKTFGYTLCQCTFPPQIMLWREKERAKVCPNPDCGRAIKQLTSEEIERQTAARPRRSSWLDPHGGR